MTVKTILEKDIELSNKLRLNPSHRFWWKAMTIIAHSGDSWYALAVLSIVWLLSKGEWHNRAAMLGFGICLQALFVLIFKQLVRRKRPPGEWGAFYRQTDPHSMPSGHAARAAMLIVLAIGLGPLWFSLLMLVWNPLVTLSRVATGVHYLSDVVVGVLLGIATGLLVLEIQPQVMALFAFAFQ